VIGAEPAQPARDLKARNIAVPVLTEHPSVNARNMKLQTWHNIKRPYNSDKGAKRTGPHTKPSMYMLTVKDARYHTVRDAKLFGK
jgi:hypothetical protein